MRLGLLVDGDRVVVADLDTGERVEGVVSARVDYTPRGVVASMTWRVSGSAGPGIFEPAEDEPEAQAQVPPPRPLSREEILAAAPGHADYPPDAPPFDDDDRPRPRRPL